MAGTFSRDGRDYYNTPDGQLVSVESGFDVASTYKGLVPATADDVAARDYEKQRAPIDVQPEYNRDASGQLNPDAALGSSSVPRDSDGLAKIREFIALEPAAPEEPKAFSRGGRDYYLDNHGKLVSVDAGFDPSEEYPDLVPATAEQVRKHEIQKRSGKFIDQVETVGHTAAATALEAGAGLYNIGHDAASLVLPTAVSMFSAPLKGSDIAPGLYEAKEKEQREANPTAAFIGAAAPDVALTLLAPGAGAEGAAARVASASEGGSLLTRAARGLGRSAGEAAAQMVVDGPQTAAARLIASSLITEAGDAVIEGHEFDMGTALGVWGPMQGALELAGNTGLGSVAKGLGWTRNAVTTAVARARSNAVKDALREVDPVKQAQKLLKTAPHVFEHAQTQLDEALGVIDDRLTGAPDKLFTRSALKRTVSNNINAQADALADLAVQAAHAAEVTGAPTLEHVAKTLGDVRGSGGAVLYDAVRRARRLLAEAGEAAGERSWAAYGVDNPLTREVLEALDQTLADENVWGRAARDHASMIAEAARGGGAVKHSVRDVAARDALADRIEQARRVASLTKDERLAKAAERAKEALDMADKVNGARLLNAKATPDEIEAMRKTVDAFPDRAEKVAAAVGKGLDAIEEVSPSAFGDTWTPQRIERHIAERAAGSRAARKELDDGLGRAEKWITNAKRAGALKPNAAARAELQIAAVRAALEEVDDVARAAKTVRDFDASPQNWVEKAIDKATGKVATGIASRAVSTVAGAAAGYAGGGPLGGVIGMVGGEALNQVVDPVVKAKATKFAGWLKDTLRKHKGAALGVAALYGANRLAYNEDDPSPQAAAAIGMLGASGLASAFGRKGSLRVLRERVRREFHNMPDNLNVVDHHIGAFVETLGDDLVEGSRRDVEAIIERAKAKVTEDVFADPRVRDPIGAKQIALRVEQTFAEAAHQLPHAAPNARASKLRDFLEHERAGLKQKGKYDEHPMIRAFPPGSYEKYRTEQVQIAHQLEEAGDGELVKSMNNVIDFNADRFVKAALHASGDVAGFIDTETRKLVDEFSERYQRQWRGLAHTRGNGRLSNVERRYITNTVKAKIMSAWQVTLDNVAMRDAESLAGKGVDIRRALKPLAPFDKELEQSFEAGVQKIRDSTDAEYQTNRRDRLREDFSYRLAAEGKLKLREAHAVLDHVIDEMLAGKSWHEAVDDAARVVNEQAEHVALTDERHFRAAGAFSAWQQEASQALGFSVAKAVKDYAGDFDYKNINALVREGEPAFTKATHAESVEWSRTPDPKAIKRNRQQAEDLQLALDYAVDNGYTAPGRTWRGVLFTPAELRRVAAAAGKGSPVEAHAFMSTSTNEDYALRFIERKDALKNNPKLKKVIFEVIQKNGVPVNPNESEVLLRAGTRFRVEEIPTRLREHARFRATELDDPPRLPSDLKHGAGGKKALPWIAGGVFALGSAEAALSDEQDSGALAAGVGGLFLLYGGKLGAGKFAKNTGHAMGLMAHELGPIAKTLDEGLVKGGFERALVDFAAYGETAGREEFKGALAHLKADTEERVIFQLGKMHPMSADQEWEAKRYVTAWIDKTLAEYAAGSRAEHVLDAEDVMYNQLSRARGTNEGGTFAGSDGVRRYVKLYDEPQQALGEAMANQVYRSVGVPAPRSLTFDVGDGRIGHASDLIKGADPLPFADISEREAKDFAKGFWADVLLANWDAVGLDYDNIVFDSAGKLYRIDNGSALKYRAQGAPKPTERLAELSEIQGFFNPQTNRSYAQMLEKAGYTDPKQLAEFLPDTIIGAKHYLENASGADPELLGILRQRLGLLEDYAVQIDRQRVKRRPLRLGDVVQRQPKPAGLGHLDDVWLNNNISSDIRSARGVMDLRKMTSLPEQQQYVGYLRKEFASRTVDRFPDLTPQRSAIEKFTAEQLDLLEKNIELTFDLPPPARVKEMDLSALASSSIPDQMQAAEAALTAEQKDALLKYTADNYATIKALQSGEKSAASVSAFERPYYDEMTAVVPQFERAVETLLVDKPTQIGALLRGVSLPEAALHELLTVDRYSPASALSATHQLHTAASFARTDGARKVILRFTDIDRAAPVLHLSRSDNEAEWIIPKGGAYDVKARAYSPETDTYYIDLAQVDPASKPDLTNAGALAILLGVGGAAAATEENDTDADGQPSQAGAGLLGAAALGSKGLRRLGGGLRRALPAAAKQLFLHEQHMAREEDREEADHIIEEAQHQRAALDDAREAQLDETRDRLSYLSQQGRTLMHSAASSAAGTPDPTHKVPRVPGVTASAGVARFLGSNSNLHEAYAEKKRALESLQRDPMALVDDLSESYSELHDTAPDLHAQVTAQTFRIAKYLRDHLPPPVGVSMTRPEGSPPSRLAIHQFALRYSAAIDPASVLTDVANNRIRREQIDTLRELWPDTYQQLKLTVLARMSEKRPTVDQRILLDLRFDFGQQFDRGLSPGLVAALNASKAQKGGEGGAAPGEGKQAPRRGSQGSIRATGALGSLGLGPASGPGTLA